MSNIQETTVNMFGPVPAISAGYCVRAECNSISLGFQLQTNMKHVMKQDVLERDTK